VQALEHSVLLLIGSPWVFAAVGAILAVGSIAVFLPSQGLVVAVASLLLAKGDVAFGSGELIVVAAVGMVVGDIGLFALARWAHLGSHSWFDRPKVRAARESLERRYEHAPTRIAILGRFIPVGRLTTNLIGADSDLHFRRFLLASGIANVSWAAYCIAIAAAFGAWSRQNPFLVTVLAVAASITLGVIVSAVDRAVRGRRDGSDSAETA
jgi:membrane protein DedA with SNARE-associated domain